jgi:hypothetical protein
MTRLPVASTQQEEELCLSFMITGYKLIIVFARFTIILIRAKEIVITAIILTP